MPDDEPVYSDGSEIEVTCEPDDPPPAAYVDSHDVIEDATDEELAAGDFLGQAIDTDDDEDDGSQWGTVADPTMRPEDFR